MKHARTRIGVGKTDFERDLLRSWKSEQPSGDAREKALAILGVGAPVSVGVGGAATAKAAKIAAVTASLPPKGATLGIGVAGKWILGSVILATVVGASAVRSRSIHDEPFNAPGSTPVNAPPIATTIQNAAPRVTPIKVPIVPVSAKIAAHEKSISAPVIAATSPIKSPETSSTENERASLALGEEVAALDRARTASASGDYAGALSFLDEYDARFPHGALAQDSAALRIEALFQEGDTENGGRLAEHFLASNPNSSHAARIHSLLTSRPSL